MPLIDVSKVFPVPASAVWNVVNDVDSYPQVLSHIRSLKVIERGEGHRVTAWEISLKCSCVMRWVEREDIDPAAMRINRRAFKGDLSELAGYWLVEAVTPDSARLTLSMKFDIGIPGLTPMVDPLTERAIRDNSELTVELLGQAAVRRNAEGVTA